MQTIEFGKRVLFVGYGSVGQCTLPILLKHVKVPCKSITVMDFEDRRKVLEAFIIQGDAETLIELFRREKDPELRKTIVQQLSMLDDPQATELLMGLLEDDQ